ncbi:MAG: hypothetical protein ABIO70_21875 [Pseudomonadota bacterium]
MSTPVETSTRDYVATLLSPRHRSLFENITRRALAEEEGDTWAANTIRSCPASHGERLIIQFAYSLWRGYGPALQVEQLQGLEPEVAERLLAGLAVIAAGEGAAALLSRAAERCPEGTPEGA